MKCKKLLMLSILSTAILLSACASNSSDISEEKTEIVAAADTETESTETTDTETESAATADTGTEQTEAEAENYEEQPDEETAAESSFNWNIEDADETMYAQKSCNIRKGPSTEFDKVGSLSKNQKVHVIGTTIYNDSTWCLIETDDSTEEYVAASLLGTSEVIESSGSSSTTDTANKQDTSSSSSDSKKDTSSNSNSSDNSNSDSSSSSGKTYKDGESETVTSASGDTFQIGNGRRGVERDTSEEYTGTGHLD
jgi:uncharacterized protein YgiM (DUF1202 family)